jgi:hypothetical protein
VHVTATGGGVPAAAGLGLGIRAALGEGAELGKGVALGEAALLGDGVLLKVVEDVEPAFRLVAPEALQHATSPNNARRTTAFM